MLTGDGSALAAVRYGATGDRARASLRLRRRLNNAPTNATIPLSSSTTDITSTRGSPLPLAPPGSCSSTHREKAGVREMRPIDCALPPSPSSPPLSGGGDDAAIL